MEDLSARDLYAGVEAGKLVKAYQQTEKTLLFLSGKLEEYPNTPYTQKTAADLERVSAALKNIGDEMRAWHGFLHPTQPSVEYGR